MRSGNRTKLGADYMFTFQKVMLQLVKCESWKRLSKNIEFSS